MNDERKELYRKARERGMDFINNEIISERLNDHLDAKYLLALMVVKETVNSAITREAKDCENTKSSD